MQKSGLNMGLLAGVSCLAMATSAWAEVAASAPDATQEVIVTGSRVKRDGFLAPTPVTVITAESLATRAPTNIADGLNRLPQFQNSISNMQSSTFSVVSNPQGNYLNLRGLGINRSLILLDGARVPPTNATGGVDINMLPQALVKRVEVVTGGASAAYGSDAVVGVVNFILDKDFTGLKATVQGSTSHKGDNSAYKISVAGGKDFAEGRGHVLFSVDHYDTPGLKQSDRDGGSDRTLTVGAGTAANPYRVIRDARYPTMAFGGLIASGPVGLRNYYFLPNGTLAPFAPGTGTGAGSAIVQGGDGSYQPVSQSLLSGLTTDQVFVRGAYELTPTLKVHAQASFGESRNTFDVSAVSFTPATLSIFADNAFLSPAIKTALGTTPSFTFGTMRRDMPLNAVDLLNDSISLNLGIEGRLNDNWSWDANYIFGTSKQRMNSYEPNLTRFYAAVDAVKDASGRTVCRVSLTNSAFAGCVPLNLFGEGNASPEAIAYMRQASTYQVNNEMQIAAVNLRGDLFSTWAGPISAAVGAEVRNQTLNQTSNSNPAIARDFTGIKGVPAGALWSSRLNAGIAAGEVKVSEAYGEVVVPLALNQFWTKSLDFTGAVRVTDYSTSGTVTTWKAGLNYQPFNDLRIRAIASKDIAAPGLSQLYAGVQSSPSSAATPDIHTNSTGTYQINIKGNANLKPETGSMMVLGFVYSPEWLPGFTASVDTNGLLIEDAITTQTTLQIQDCEASNGRAAVCAQIVRPFPFENRTAANYPTAVNIFPQNLSKQYTVNTDIEVSYRAPVSQIIPSLPGIFSVRGLATYNPVFKRKVSPFNPTQSAAGGTFGGDLVNEGFPKWLGSVEVGYSNGPLQLGVTSRFTGQYRRDFYQVMQDYQVAPNKTYTDLNAKYDFGEDSGFEGFAVISNLFNVEPPIIASAQNPGLQYPTNKRSYDVVGRYITVGLKYRM